MMSRVGGTPVAADMLARRRVVVDVILLLMRNGRILLRERANTGYGDGAYEPPSGELADRETIVETAIRVAAAAGIAIDGENVSLAHVMHDVSGSGRIAFFLSVSGWTGQPTSPDVCWFPAGDLPTNMLDRARVALRNYADGMRFSTYPAFVPAGAGGTNIFGAGESHGANGVPEATEFTSRNGNGNGSGNKNGNGSGNRNGNGSANRSSNGNGSRARRKEAYSGRVVG